MARRLTLIASAATPGLRHGLFPSDEKPGRLGLEHAAGLGPTLPPGDRCRCGPSPAAQVTAEALGLTATLEPALREPDYGRWRGRPLKEIAAEEAGALALWLADPAEAPHGGESIAALMARVSVWLAGRVGEEGRTIAVAEPPVVRAAICCTLGADGRAFRNLDVAPLARVELGSDGRRWALRFEGHPPHHS